MTECISDYARKEDFFIEMSPWGDFFVWSAKHVEWIRKEHRIVGRISLSTGTRSFSAANKIKASSSGATTYSVHLPLRLSLEETSLLLYKGVACGIDAIKPISLCQPPSLCDLVRFDLVCAAHLAETAPVYRLQKRQRMLGYYGEMLRGKLKRKLREADKARKHVDVTTQNPAGKIPQLESPLTDDAKFQVSKNKIKKKIRRGKRAKLTNSEESANDYLDDDDCNEVEEQDNESCKDQEEPFQTLEALDPTSSGLDDASMAPFIHIHRPRPTPHEWRRINEHCLIPLPTELSNITAIASWLFTLSVKTKVNKNQSTMGQQPQPNSVESESDDLETAVLRCQVFENLWSKGSIFITCSASKIGGDFLLYQGDPLFFHASHIVTVHRPDALIYLSRLAASLRIANSVRKVLLLATTTHPDDSSSLTDIIYTSLYWTGSRHLSSNTNAQFV